MKERDVLGKVQLTVMEITEASDVQGEAESKLGFFSLEKRRAEGILSKCINA